jgi:hypothetical protein
VQNYIHQIFHSDETRQALDPGFIALDNTGQRPDWFEYGAIRCFFDNRTLDRNTRYGFFSPKFAMKTRLSAAKVDEFLAATPEDVDVVTFSPFFDQAAYFLNTFEQACAGHPGIVSAIESTLRLIAPGIDIKTLVMSSVQTVYCNFLIAKPTFWQEWLNRCEVIFQIAEANDTPLAQHLNADVPYKEGRAPAKVFLIERVASLMLATQSSWKVRNYNSMTLPISDSRLAPYGGELVAMDALKFAAKETGMPEYLAAFLNLRQRVGELIR